MCAWKCIQQKLVYLKDDLKTNVDLSFLGQIHRQFYALLDLAFAGSLVEEKYLYSH